MSFVNREIKRFPDRDGLRRAILITDALGRLAERGIHSDWLVRRHIGPELLRRIIIISAVIWQRITFDGLERKVFNRLEPWLREIDADVPEDYREHEFSRLVIACLSGQTHRKGMEWLATAAMAHIIDWRLGGYLVSEPDLADQAPPGGLEVATWLYERFSQTYLADWSRASLFWEMAYLRDPQKVAETTSIPMHILNERNVTLEQLLDASSELVLNHEDEPLPGMRKQEFFENIVAQLERGEIERACSIAKDAADRLPRNRDLVAIYAFCLLPIDPAKSRATFQHTSRSSLLPDQITAINLASAFLCENQPHKAKEVLDSADWNLASTKPAWLWDPKSLLQHNARLRFTTITDWKNRYNQLFANGELKLLERQE
ncbi:MAG: hypothetical protein Q4P71_06620 [Actinomycetaceae bacterium]|nr:hypothetical protein [Actinomycetaceae bacterium]